jgi:hypothetical protein
VTENLAIGNRVEPVYESLGSQVHKNEGKTGSRSLADFSKNFSDEKVHKMILGDYERCLTNLEIESLGRLKKNQMKPNDPK